MKANVSISLKYRTWINATFQLTTAVAINTYCKQGALKVRCTLKQIIGWVPRHNQTCRTFNDPRKRDINCAIL